jgi:hypothetical protein
VSEGFSEDSPAQVKPAGGTIGGKPGAEREPDEVVEEPPLSIQGDVDESEPRLRRERHVEKTRAGLAWALFLTFAGTVLAVILIVATGSHTRGQEASELLKTLLPAETALLGSAVGFYFGTRDRH